MAEVKYDLKELPHCRIKLTKGGLVSPDAAGLKWSGGRIPRIGEVVEVKINAIGAAVVESYFIEDNWLGLLVKPSNPPEWYVRQKGADASCHVFGEEIK